MTDRPSLADTSVVARSRQPVVNDRLEELLLRGWLYSCRVVDLEILFSTRTRDISEVMHKRMLLPEARITPDVLDRAVEVVGLLAASSQHRATGAVDVVVAAAAEAAGIPVLHYDRGFDVIAEVTGQDTEWVAPPGSLDRA